MSMDAHVNSEADGEAQRGMNDSFGAETPAPVLDRAPVPLTRLRPGEVGQIVSLSPGRARDRLMEMGLTSGVQIELVRFAPLGGPVDVKVRGYRLSLRRRDAEAVRVLAGECGADCPGQSGLCLDPLCPKGQPDVATSRAPITYAVIGNPNCGKTTLFNALTGLRQRVGNYPGVTVEKKEGQFDIEGRRVHLLDLPGLYALSPQSPDEAIARDVLLGRRQDVERPNAVINVIDASNLERNLLLTSQLMDLGLPMIIVLTMTDVARKNGVHVDPERLERALGIPVRSVVVSRKHGVDALRHALTGVALVHPAGRPWSLSPLAETALANVQELVCKHSNLDPPSAFTEALLYLSRGGNRLPIDCPRPVRDAVLHHEAVMKEEGLDFAMEVTEARYAWVDAVTRMAVQDTHRKATTLSDQVDRIILHPVYGMALFLVLMAVVFHAIFSWAQTPMDLIGAGVDTLGGYLTTHMAEGDLRDLLVNGVLGGVGTTLTFLPQILLLLLFVGLLEDTGYMARAAFLMDRIMSRVGLHGRSFIPLMSSFACAIPGILATRTIDNRKSRLVTILVAPLMSCSARLPVYALMIAACIPPTLVFGFASLRGIVLISMYVLGTGAAFGMAYLFRKTLLKGESNLFLLELPPYRLPHPKTVLLQMLERTAQFLRKATTVILAMSVVLWALSTYPKMPDQPPSVQVEQSYAGRLGKTIEPLIRPLGFDWRIGISIVSSFAAREVFVASMGTIYNVGSDAGAESVTLQNKLRSERDPLTGKRVFTPLLGIAVMVYYVLAMQCISTIAVVRRETGSWGWALFQIAYMTALAWIVTFIVYQGGRALGF